MPEIPTTLKEFVGPLRRQLSGDSLSGDEPRASLTPTVSTNHGSAQLFRPMHRPPMALVGLLSDGREHVEWFHVRTGKFLIGRAEGDVVIPHDDGISSRHVEIERVIEDGEYRWYLSDLQSTNGTYANVAKTLLKHLDEFIIGGRHFQFKGPSSAIAANAPPEQAETTVRQVTQKWQVLRPIDPESLQSSLVELHATGEQRQHFLRDSEHWVGTDSRQCSIVIENDPFTDPRHARLFRDDKSRWWIEDGGSLNDTWYRISRTRITRRGFFQIGEQRLVVRVA